MVMGWQAMGQQLGATFNKRLLGFVEWHQEVVVELTSLWAVLYVINYVEEKPGRGAQGGPATAFGSEGSLPSQAGMCIRRPS
jgi:hypothetical protein